ncbi:MAG TPA: sigma-54 dependent transcriptional regulator [Sphingomonas sp.]|nr:sigma-54 dependent transcriptional regulator [Sphingomonas sp.]
MTVRLPCRRVAFVDDDADLRRANVQSLELAGFEPVACASAAEASSRIGEDFDGVVVSDLRMPDMDGLQLFAALRARDPELPVILVTGHGDVATAVKAIQGGAYDFLTKPYAPDELLRIVGRALEQRALALDNRRLRREADRAAAASALIGVSPEIERLRRTIDQIGPAEIDILIEGETGTGKSLVAALLHRAGGARRPMVTLDAGALPQAMAESELFGHVAGAFPGAHHSRVGRIEAAEHGTLFLDNVDALPPAIQPKLLRAIEDRVIMPLGADAPRPIAVRILAASGVGLAAQVREKRFLDALLYRLNAVTLRLPPLRERRGDVPMLFDAFVGEAARRHRRERPAITAAHWARLDGHAWPGNARELRHYAERVVLGIDESSHPAHDAATSTLKERIERFEAAQLRAALADARGNVVEATKALRLPRKTFYDKLKRHRIDPRAWRR